MDLMQYRQRDKNQLANCMLLTAQENGAGRNFDTSPDERLGGERSEEDYLNMHLIPRDPALWKLDRVEEFIQEP
jgi:hypothetical protein